MLQTLPNITQLSVMNTTPYLRHKVSPKIKQMHKQTDNETTGYSPEMYEQVLEYYRHKNEYFPD